MILRYVLRHLVPQAAAQSASAVRRSEEIDWPCLQNASSVRLSFVTSYYCHVTLTDGNVKL